MADIDMIPRSYRETLRVRRTLSAYGIALAALLLAGGGASALLRWRVAVETPELDRLRSQSVQAGAMRTQLAGVQQRRDALAEEVAALAALRGSGATAALAAALDQTLNDRVWLGQLRFSRTQELLRDPLPSPLPADAVTAHAAPAAGAAPVLQAWRLASHVELSGHALDHAAMSSFLGALSSSKALKNVRFLNSAVGGEEEGRAVSFSAAASLANEVSP